MKKKLYQVLLFPLITILLAFPVQLFAQPGALDPSFGHGGITVSTERSEFANILPLANGQFLVTDAEIVSRRYENGAIESFAYSTFWRYNANGTLDQTFGTNGRKKFFSSDEYHQYFTSFAVLTDGRIVATETGQVLGGTPFGLNRIWIFNSDGTGGRVLTELFVFGYFYVSLADIAVDKNNRIVVTGHVRPNLSTEKTKTYIARLLDDGTPDLTFFGGGFRILVENTSHNYSGEQVTTDASNNIIIREEGVYNAEQGFFISKFRENGSMETSFPYFKTGFLVKSLHTDGNSRIVFLDNNFIKRLNTNGTLDLNFTPGFTPREVIVQPDNKIVAIGSSGSVFRVGRFAADGTADQSFGTNGIATSDLNLTANAAGVIYRNRRLYLSGFIMNMYGFGTIIAYDASDVRMTCPTPQNPYSVDAGKCYATVNNINAIMSSSTLWANVQHTMVHNNTTVQGVGGVAGRQFQLGTTRVTYSYSDITTQTCSFDITVTDQDPPVARCKNVTVQLDASGSGTLTAAQVNNGSTDGCGIQSMSLDKTSFTCSDATPQTVTLTVTDINGNSSTCTATVTVEDNVVPVAKCKNITVYLDATGNVTITPDQIDDGSTDACGIKSLSLNRTTFDCTNKGANQVTLTVTDNNDNVSTSTATVTVTDNIAPIISRVVPTPANLWPADRKMKLVTIATTSTDNCPDHSCRITSVAIKAGVLANDNLEPDWEITGDNTVNLRAEIPKKGVKRIYTVTVTCTDEAGNTSPVTTDVVVSAEGKTASIANASGAELPEIAEGLQIAAFPNPAKSSFTLTVNSNNSTEKIMMQVYDVNGRLLEVRNVQEGSVIRIGNLYRPGVYYLRVLQGKQYRELKLMKVSE